MQESPASYISYEIKPLCVFQTTKVIFAEHEDFQSPRKQCSIDSLQMHGSSCAGEPKGKKEVVVDSDDLKKS